MNKRNKENNNTIDVFNYSLKLINELKIFILKNGNNETQNFYETIYPLFCAYKIPEVLIRNESNLRLKYLILAKAIFKSAILILNFFLSSLLNTFKKIKPNHTDILYLNFSKRHLKETFSDVLPQINNLKKIYIGERDKKHENELIQYINIKNLISLKTLLMALIAFSKNLKNNYSVMKKFIKSRNDKIINPFFIEIILFHNIQYIFFSYLSKKLIHSFKPRLIVTGDDNNPICRSLIIEAKKNNIKCLLIQQGLSSDLSVDYNFFLGDEIAAINEISKKTFIKMGISNEKITVTGRPSFSKLKSMKNKSKNKILFTSQPYSGGILFKNSLERMQYLEILYKDFSKLDNIILEVKPHPDEPLNTHLSIKKKLNFKELKLFPPHYDTTKLLNESDFLISFGSTTIIEGAISKSLVMIFDPFNRMNEFDYFNNKVPIFNDIKSLCNEINFLSKNLDAFGERLKIQNKNLADYLVDFDSALRVSKLITNLL